MCLYLNVASLIVWNKQQFYSNIIKSWNS